MINYNKDAKTKTNHLKLKLKKLTLNNINKRLINSVRICADTSASVMPTSTENNQ